MTYAGEGLEEGDEIYYDCNKCGHSHLSAKLKRYGKAETGWLGWEGYCKICGSSDITEVG